MKGSSLFGGCGGPEKGRLACVCLPIAHGGLLGTGILCDCFGALADSMFGQFAREYKTHCSLNLSACYGGALVVIGKTWCFGGYYLKYVVYEAVHNWHCFGWYTSVGVDLFHDFVDVNAVTLLPLSLSFLVAGTSGLGLSSLLCSFSTSLWSHGFDRVCQKLGRAVYL